ncbi:hypothetical protein ZYGR_0N01070 [Zygosaccharomyces rouxii]|uniref:ZYRO0D02904p n=2 Tax=Zygosaccharomyces rouxii TaxID=4956 RepID=C5DV06_ZYGRC|nr:uncharacterized protein ZYRO0D02904g [Zygosaccharomyces rouxii]KAH9200539.1 hypothetical protein LQ764DRAFT_95899 [Zygosaccharomyces rouxii]GAV48703.1 hypothetical protein ZYGR_0N01070 [Zygosaccharomyces rouxii]CAR27625.1 ZYRO0D02904p [Zygosaccharomyces rouxii]
MKSQVSVIKDQRYSLSIEKDDRETFVKFTVIPSSYALKSVVNFLLLIVLNSIAMKTCHDKLELPFYKAVMLRLAIFVVTSMFLRKPTIESMTVIRNYGVEVTKENGLVVCPNSWIQPWIQRSDFLARDLIVDVIINEGFVKNQQVIFYLAILVREAKRLTLLFSVCAL